MMDQRANEWKVLVEEALRRALPSREAEPRVLHQAMRYAVFPGGKRFRPLVLLGAAEASGLRLPAEFPTEGPALLALRGAAAVELVHSYSLIHDDLPAMDDASERRGLPTCHVAFGEDAAILAGDALLNQAFYHLALPLPGVDPGRQLQVIEELGRAGGSEGLVGGQMMDMRAVLHDLETVREIFRRKTGALIRAAARMGAIAAGADGETLEKITSFGEDLGFAFQVADDLKDLKAGERAPYPALAGPEEAAREVEERLGRCRERLAALSSRGNTALLEQAVEMVERWREEEAEAPIPHYHDPLH